jgi:hypothetical protein
MTRRTRLTLVQFNQLQVRESEAEELELLAERVPCDVQVGVLSLLRSFGLSIFIGRHRY